MAAKKRSKAKAGAARRAPARKAQTTRAAKTKKPSTSRAAAASARASASRRAEKKVSAEKRALEAAPAGAAERGKTAPSKAAKSAPSSAEVAAGPDVGDSAPAFELTDHAGNQLSSADLAGRPYVLYFYPKDDTPGCTVEACGFRDSAAAFDALGVRVVGVSPDSVASHQRFRAKYGLPFSLLSDQQQRLASAYGVWSLKKNYGREYMGIVRSTFLVDGAGTIRNSWRGVRVKGHVDEVQAAAKALS